MLPGSGRCHYHPDRAGLGICVECRRVICRECTTPFEGINRCAQCLNAKHAEAKRLGARTEWSVGTVLLALIGFAVFFGGVYLTAAVLSR
ncbi:MAG: hypothetical protein ACT4TC_13890 [Myxococcaceae bacterium]